MPRLIPITKTAERQIGIVANQLADISLVCGVDIVEIAPFARAVKVGGESFLQEIYTERERAHCRGRVPQLAARFAAKEAVAKALGTGVRGISWTDMEIASESSGIPRIVLSGTAAAEAARAGLDQWALSLSHSESYAMAFVVATSLQSLDRSDCSSVEAQCGPGASTAPGVAPVPRPPAWGAAAGRGSSEHDEEKEDTA